MAEGIRGPRPAGPKRATRRAGGRPRKPTAPAPEKSPLSLQIALALDEMARVIDESEDTSGSALAARWRRDIRTKIAVWESVGLDVSPVRDLLDIDLTHALALAQTYEQNLPRLEAMRPRVDALARKHPGDPGMRELEALLRRPLDVEDLEERIRVWQRHGRLDRKSTRLNSSHRL